MDTGKLTSRRRFLCLTGGLAAGIALPAIQSTVRAAQREDDSVNPVEELMREHGILSRLLLIYEETADRLRRKEETPPGVIEDSAAIIHRYVHDYHERLEEEEIFPRLRNGENLDDLITVLAAQHQAGRRLTDSILKTLKPEPVKPAEEEPKEENKMPAAMDQIYGGTPLITHLLGKETQKMKMTQQGIPHRTQDVLIAIEEFVRMYRPHTTREDTVLFTAFHSVVSPREFRRLGEKFQNRGRELFGEQGFQNMVASVAAIEGKLGIYDLRKFTPVA